MTPSQKAEVIKKISHRSCRRIIFLGDLMDEVSTISLKKPFKKTSLAAEQQSERPMRFTGECTWLMRIG